MVALGNFDEELKMLESEDLTLELSLGIKESLQFYYRIFDKEKHYVGNCGIRLEDIDKHKYLGNIEYEIFEQFRGNNYAEKASRLLTKVAIFYNASSITITADPTNIASNKTIKNLGARFIDVRRVPKKYELYKVSKQVNAYILDLER